MEQRSVSWIAQELTNGVSGLVRGEVRLAKAELTAGAKDAGKQVAKVAVAGVIAALGVLALLAFAVIGLGELLDGRYWLSALIVSLALLIPGAILAISGARKIKFDASLPETRDSLREDARVINGRVRSLSQSARRERETGFERYTA